jgi:hypothetical protein
VSIYRHGTLGFEPSERFEERQLQLPSLATDPAAFFYVKTTVLREYGIGEDSPCRVSPFNARPKNQRVGVPT